MSKIKFHTRSSDKRDRNVAIDSTVWNITPTVHAIAKGSRTVQERSEILSSRG